MNSSKTPFRIGFPAALAGAAALFFFGCVATGGGEVVETVGDYGYVGPWVYPAFEPAGYEGARPPYEKFDPNRHEEPIAGAARGPGNAPAPGREPGQGRAPEPVRSPAPVRNNPRPPPSIPNQPRPSMGGGGGGARSGGGGGGGGSHGSGGSGRK
ncbi:MAG: hypothetical protein ABSA05_10940 [Opitutaceae bacterium]